jgi:phenylpropionate dioxygenase-like ring-hydroxylating dioxygenase large terminal subunit
MPTESRGRNEPDLRSVGIHPDFWYPLARSGEVRSGRTHLATFAGEPIVLVRAASGQVFALDDRCAHRQFPLHRGVVCGEMLRCAYHAWTYRQDGQIASVPYLPKGAARPAGVRSYPCREAYGHVFVFPGERDKAAQVPIPELSGYEAPNTRTMAFWRKVACHYSFMHENLMDMNHQFLHRGIMGTIKPTLLGFERGPDWVEARYRFQRTAGKSARGARLLLAGGGGGAPASSDGQGAAGADLMTIRTIYPYQVLSLFRGGASHPSFNLWAAYVPVDREQRANISMGLLTIERPSLPGLINVFWPMIRRFAEAVFTEDRAAVEAEQQAYDRQQADYNQEINPVIIALREVLVRNGVPFVNGQSRHLAVSYDGLGVAGTDSVRQPPGCS